MRKNIKKFIIALLFILIVLMIIILFIMMHLKKLEENESIEDIRKSEEIYMQLKEDASPLFDGKKLEEVVGESTFFTIDGIINKYYTYIQESNSEAVYNILYAKYIDENNITQENVLNILNRLNNYTIADMYGISADGYGIYYVEVYNDNMNEFLIINRDLKNSAFSIFPTNEEKYKEGIDIGIEVDKERIKSIEQNEFNKVMNINLDQDSVASKYFNDFIKRVLYSTEETYNNILDENYKKINFITYEDFQEYLNNNIQRFENLDKSNQKSEQDFSTIEEYEKYKEEKSKHHISNYTKNREDGITTYIFLDSFGKYYIFKVTAAMKYTVLLDTYTIPTEEFIETYNNSTDAQKVVLDIKKFFMGIDDKNYGYSYSLLADSFKSNKYPTKNDFVNFAKQNFFEENEIEYVRYEVQNGVYIYNINITDATGNSQEKKALNMIVKLNNGTDFEMSFGTD